MDARRGGQERVARLLQWEPHRRAPGSPGGLRSARNGDQKRAERLLEWGTSRRAKRAQSIASSRKRKDLTPKSEASNLEGLPRKPIERSADGARPNLENSTACQKSMPIPRLEVSADLVTDRRCDHIERKSFG
jgi:hypothetical protein